MRFCDKGLLDTQGKYGQVGKCTVNGHAQIYKTARFDIDYSLEIEHEASALLSHHPSFYRVNTVSCINGISTLLMDPISGPTLHDFMNHQVLEASLVQAAHILLSIQMMNEHGITHNDLHLGNILITKTSRPRIVYRLKNKTFILKTFGYRPVFIDFGLAFIKGFKYRPSIVSDDAGNVCYAVFEPRFDLVRFLLFFSYEIDRLAQEGKRRDMGWFPSAVAFHVQNPTQVAVCGMFERGRCANIGETAIAFFGQFHYDVYNTFSQYFMSLLPNVQRIYPINKMTPKQLQKTLYFIASTLDINADRTNAIRCKRALDTNLEPDLKLALERLASVFNNIVLAEIVRVNHNAVKRQFDRMPLQTGSEWVQAFFRHRIKADE